LFTGAKVKTRGKSSRFLQVTAGKGKPYGLKGQISSGISGSFNPSTDGAERVDRMMLQAIAVQDK